MAVPSLDELHRPVLELMNGASSPLTRKQVTENLIVAFALTDSDMQEIVPSGQSRIENSANWAMTDLKKAGLIDNPQRNQWEITQTGREYVATHSGIIKFQELEKMWPERGDDTHFHTSISPGSVENTPEEQIARSYQQQRDKLSDEILENIKAISPSSFERLVVELLAKMGYGEGKAVGKSGDGGIDGILNQDTLGLEQVYVQAKRYESAQVPEPEIRNFSGSLDPHGASKGVFLTTSTFSSTARQTAQNISRGGKSIRLIDGKELADLMVRHSVGVVTEITYEVKKLDANYFAEV